jgi:hypothetical protein
VTRLPQSSTTIGSNITHPKLPLKKGGTYSSGIFNRMFSKSSLPLTHSRAHLTMQQERLQKLEIQTEIATLPKGSIVIGLNVNYPKDYSLGTVPCYKQVALKRLSQGEKNEWEELSKKYHAQVGHYSLICEITCVTLFSENGEKVYLIDPRVLDPVSYTPLEKLLASFE